jgi:hypothetical protein
MPPAILVGLGLKAVQHPGCFAFVGSVAGSAERAGCARARALLMGAADGSHTPSRHLRTGHTSLVGSISGSRLGKFVAEPSLDVLDRIIGIATVTDVKGAEQRRRPLHWTTTFWAFIRRQQARHWATRDGSAAPDFAPECVRMRSDYFGFRVEPLCLKETALARGATGASLLG